MNNISKWNLYWLKFWLLYYSYTNGVKRKITVGGIETTKRVYPSWRWCLAIAMFETKDFKSESACKNHNYFAMTVGSITKPYISGEYSGESTNMARFKNPKKAVQAFFAWFKHHKMFDNIGVFATTPEFDGFPKYTFNTEDWVTFMSDHGYFTADRDVYNNGVWSKMAEVRKQTNPMIVFVAVVSILLLFLIILIRWLLKKNKPKKKRLSKIRSKAKAAYASVRSRYSNWRDKYRNNSGYKK